MEDGLRMERRRIPRELRESAAGRKGTRRSEKAKVPEEALLTRSSKAKKTYEHLCILSRNHKHSGH